MDEMKAVEAIQAENKGLKETIDRLFSEKQALDSTVKDLLNANINLKSNGIYTENKLNLATMGLSAKDQMIENLKKEMEDLKNPSCDNPINS